MHSNVATPRHPYDRSTVVGATVPPPARRTSVVVGLPCDAGPDRLAALLETAAELGRIEQCPVVLLHAMRRQSELHEPNDVVRARRVRRTRELLAYARSLLVAKAGDRVPVATMSSLLPPVTALVETGGFGGVLLLQQWSDPGQTTSTLIDAVAAQAHCPVLVQDRAGSRPLSLGRRVPSP